jgi:hemerythrin-like domain-containing protein
MSTLIRQPWADTPFKLIPTPFGSKDLTAGKAHGSQYIAQQMTHLHNCIIRLLNSIYNQALHVQSPEDIRDFLAYVKHWHDELDHHHLVEEEFMFPKLDALTGDTIAMETNIEQHHAFEPGLKALGEYATSTTAEEYDGEKLRAIIDDFGEILTTHLADEIPTLLALGKCDDKALRKMWADTFYYVIKTADFVSISLYPMIAHANMRIVRAIAHAYEFIRHYLGGRKIWRP